MESMIRFFRYLYDYNHKFLPILQDIEYRIYETDMDRIGYLDHHTQLSYIQLPNLSKEDYQNIL